MADFIDRVLKCVDCGADFVFSAGEQLFYAEKNFLNEPKRCKACKANRQQGMGRRAGGRSAGKPEAAVTCSQCGREAKVPFVPVQGRPVYCHDCFQQRRAAATPGRLQ